MVKTAINSISCMLAFILLILIKNRIGVTVGKHFDLHGLVTERDLNEEIARVTYREIVPELTNLPDFICPLAMAKKLSG